MSRLYRMEVIVKKIDKMVEVESQLKKEWDFNSTSKLNSTLYLLGEGWLCSGESEEEFANRIAQEAWVANDGFCEVEIEAMYLEDLPSEYHYRGINEYNEWKQEQNDFS